LLDVDTIWLAIVGMGIITFLLRLSFIAVLGRVRLSALARRCLDFIPLAVFAALILPDLAGFTEPGAFSVTIYARMIAGGIAAVVAWRTRNVLFTICSGLAVLLILQTLL